MLFISEAMAQTQETAATAPSAISNFIPLILIFGIFYFLLIRPQQNKIKEHNAMVDAISKGDEIVTGGGIVGKVKKVDGEVLHVDIATDVTVQVLRNTVSSKNISEKANKKDSPKQVKDKKDKK